MGKGHMEAMQALKDRMRSAKPTKAVTKLPVAIPNNVTMGMPLVTKSKRGRPALHGSPAAKAKAYRDRKKAPHG